MPKLGMESIRRAQLIEATYEAVYQHGLADATVARISSLAGVSSGIVSHYFGGKNALLEAAMREILKKLKASVARYSAKANTPQEKILAIIEGNFDHDQVAPRFVTTWFAFWARAMHVPALARLQRANNMRLQANLVYWFKMLLPPREAVNAAKGMAALIDGLWLRGAFGSEGINPVRAREIASMYLSSVLEKHGKAFCE